MPFYVTIDFNFDILEYVTIDFNFATLHRLETAHKYDCVYRHD